MVCLQLMKRQEEFYDIPTSNMTPVQIREKLAQIGADVGFTQTQIAQFADALRLKSTPNGGTAVTDELKYTSKYFLSIPGGPL